VQCSLHEGHQWSTRHPKGKPPYMVCDKCGAKKKADMSAIVR